MLLALWLLIPDTTAVSTVGDTVWVSRSVAVPGGVMVRPRPFRAQAPVEPLGAPEVVLWRDSAQVRYPVVAWEPGRQVVTAPGPILIREDGWSDTLPDWRVTLEVGSVLPSGVRDSMAPRDAAAPLPLRARSLRPLAVSLAVALLALLPLHLLWRRRHVPAATGPAPLSAVPEAALLRRWAEQGEWRAALEGWHHRLQEAAGPEAARLREDLRAMRFGPCPTERARALLEHAEAWEAGR